MITLGRNTITIVADDPIDKVKATQQKPKKPANKYSKTEIKITNKISQWLQNNGFEEASKAIDCEFEL